MTDFDRATADLNAADAAFDAAMDKILKDFIKAKEKVWANPTPANYEKKREAAKALSNARSVARKDRPTNHEVGGDFRGDDARAFMPEGEGGDNTKALQLLTDLFASRGDRQSDPATVLAEMRAGIT